MGKSDRVAELRAALREDGHGERLAWLARGAPDHQSAAGRRPKPARRQRTDEEIKRVRALRAELNIEASREPKRLASDLVVARELLRRLIRWNDECEPREAPIWEEAVAAVRRLERW